MNTAMRLFARFFALMAIVLGMSVALAWAWDHADVPPTEQPVR